MVNAATNTVTGNISLDAGSAPHSMCVSPDGSKLYVANGNLQSVSIVDLTTNTVAADISVGSFPYGMCLSPDGNRLYVANTYSSTISVINLSDNSVSTIPIGLANGVSLNADGSLLYATNSSTDELWVINTVNDALVSKIPTGLYPTSLGNFVTTNNICNSSPVTFTITINPSSVTPAITVGTASGNIAACQGSASASPNIEQFTVSGSRLTNNITVTAPVNFEVSLTAGSNYGNSVTILQSGGIANNTTVYVRSAASATGHISGNVTLTSPGASTQNVSVLGLINPLPMANTPGNQTVNGGSNTTAINFTGTANTFNWVNNTPGIGLPASGTGNISAFTAINTGTSAITATITATPVSSGFAYIANSSSQTVSVVNTTTNTVVANIQVGTSPWGVSVNPDGSRIYVVNAGSNSVSAINTSNNAVIATIPGIRSGKP